MDFTSYFHWVPPLEILITGVIVSGLLYALIGWIFQITGIERAILRIFGQRSRIGNDSLPRAVGKYIAVFVFLLFVRRAVSLAGYVEVEEFMSKVLNYLPHLLLALLITFFGIQTSHTAYKIVYNALRFDNKTTASVLWHVARVVIGFFTFTIVLDQINYGIQIIPDYLIKSILIGFVSAISIAAGLSFWLGGRKAAEHIIGQFLEKDEKSEKTWKNLKK